MTKSALSSVIAFVILPDEPSLFSSATNFMTEPTPVIDHSSPSAAAKREPSFAYDPDMTFDPPPSYQSSVGYNPLAHNPMSFDYPVHRNPVSLADMLANSAPFATVAPSATSGFSEDDVSAYNLSVEIAELSISSPASSPFFRAESVGPSPTLMPMSRPQPIQACDPRVLDSPVIMEQSVIQAGSSTQVEGSPHSRAPSCYTPTADSDYAPGSGESEKEDENDGDYGGSRNKKKARSARVSQAAHPYLRPAPKAKNTKGRATQLDIPTPVPGLTKNSRGRTVPKKTEIVFEDGSRSFWCSVEGCDKLFGRAEHLKRHVKSIHTNETRETPPFRFLL
jgi:hypothetical protein